MFPGAIPASQEIWVFGDELLQQSVEWLKKLECNAQSTETQNPQLYIHERYNVRSYLSPTSEEKSSKQNFILRIRNEIATTVMRKILLPQKILVMISSSKLDNPVFGIECMEGLFRWLLDEIEDIIKFQKRCLPEKSKNFDTPAVYFLKILPKPNGTPGNNLFKGVRRKFNNTLQTMLEAYHHFGFINVHEITTRPKDEKFFAAPDSGILSDEGTIQLWDSISQTFKAIDLKQKPKSMMRDQGSQWDPNDFRSDRKSYGRDSHQRKSFHESRTHNYYNDADRYPNRPNYSNQYYY